MWYIYKLQNKINGKIYIGQTCQRPEERWNDHRRHGGQLNTPISKAIGKYGWDNFEKSIIDTASTQKEADEKEIYWINLYKCNIIVNGKDYGYNVALGGSGNTRISQEERNKVLELWNNNYNITQIANELKRDRHGIADIISGYGISNEEIKRRKFLHLHSVYVFNKTGVLLKNYPSLMDTDEAYPDINKTQIRNVLKHKLASTHNLIFLYEEDLDRLNEHIERSKKQHKGKIKSINIKTQESIIYKSMKEAQDSSGIDRHTIRKYINENIIKNDIIWEDYEE